MIQLVCTDISTVSEADYRELHRAASPERQARADRSRVFADRVRCVAAEALLRYALCCRGIPGAYRVARTPHGKPFLPDVPELHYSLSHSGRWLAIAWSHAPVGLDIETIAPRPSAERIARRHFTPAEQQYLLEVSGPERLTRFYRLWTAKEAWVKYLGTGLSEGLSSFSVIPPDALPVAPRWRTLPECCLCLYGADDTDRMQLLPAAQLTALHRNHPDFCIKE